MTTPRVSHSESGNHANLEPAWDHEDDPCNPLKWCLRKKLASTAMVSLFTFINPLASAMLAPALPEIAHDLHVVGNVETEMMLSSFILGYLVGPLIWAPLSEMFGRVIIIHVGNAIFLVFNLGCGFAQNLPEMIIFRFFAGFGGIASLSCGSGLLSDCWNSAERARVWAFFILMPMIGPSLGPIMGGFIVDNVTWRWMFWSTTIFGTCTQVLSIFFLHETYAPIILRRRAIMRRKQTGLQNLEIKSNSHGGSLTSRLSLALRRPVVMLCTQPVLLVMAIYGAFLYGYMYLILTTFASVWTSVYGESVSIAGLNYLSFMIGFAVGELGTAAAQDRYYRWRVQKSVDKKGQPEFRLPILIFEALILPIGLFWYGWSIQSRAHWILPNIGIAITAASIMGSSQLVTLYVVDSFERYAASAVSGMLILRFIAGFSFPLFAPDMYRVLGWGWGNSLLAFLSLAIGVPTAVLLLIFSEALRVKNVVETGV